MLFCESLEADGKPFSIRFLDTLNGIMWDVQISPNSEFV
jgi:hypothetical protein